MQATLSYIHVNSGNYNREYPTSSSSYMIVEITTGIPDIIFLHEITYNVISWSVNRSPRLLH